VIESFDNIGVAVTDYKKSVDFYGKLGFDVDYEDGESGMLRAGNALLYVFKTSSTAQPQSRDVSLTGNPPGIDHISFRVPDVDGVYDELIKAGLKVETEPADQDWGSRTITILDPDGNRIFFLGPLKGNS
jgi:catechol 2,3-dioxygenase-like lactoylglutathione lyase family enzyme